MFIDWLRRLFGSIHKDSDRLSKPDVLFAGVEDYLVLNFDEVKICYEAVLILYTVNYLKLFRYEKVRWEALLKRLEKAKNNIKVES